MLSSKFSTLETKYNSCISKFAPKSFKSFRQNFLSTNVLYCSKINKKCFVFLLLYLCNSILSLKYCKYWIFVKAFPNITYTFLRLYSWTLRSQYFQKNKKKIFNFYFINFVIIFLKNVSFRLRLIGLSISQKSQLHSLYWLLLVCSKHLGAFINCVEKQGEGDYPYVNDTS